VGVLQVARERVVSLDVCLHLVVLSQRRVYRDRRVPVVAESALGKIPTIDPTIRMSNAAWNTGSRRSPTSPSRRGVVSTGGEHRSLPHVEPLLDKRADTRSSALFP